MSVRSIANTAPPASLMASATIPDGGINWGSGIDNITSSPAGLNMPQIGAGDYFDGKTEGLGTGNDADAPINVAVTFTHRADDCGRNHVVPWQGEKVLNRVVADTSFQELYQHQGAPITDLWSISQFNAYMRTHSARIRYGNDDTCVQLRKDFRTVGVLQTQIIASFKKSGAITVTIQAARQFRIIDVYSAGARKNIKIDDQLYDLMVRAEFEPEIKMGYVKLVDAKEDDDKYYWQMCPMAFAAGTHPDPTLYDNSSFTGACDFFGTVKHVDNSSSRLDFREAKATARKAVFPDSLTDDYQLDLKRLQHLTVVQGL